MSIVPPTIYNEYQNPLYPEDAALTDDEIAAKMRERSLVRAQAPGELVCKIEQTSSWAHPDHIHPSDVYFNYRHNTIEEGRIIPDGAPWASWWTYWDWADQVGIPPPPLPPPPMPKGWYPRARIVPHGITQMDWWWATGNAPGSYDNIVVRLEPEVCVWGPGIQTRLWLSALFGPCEITSMWIGPAIKGQPWTASRMDPVLVGGQRSWPMNGPYWKTVSDILTFGIDASNGILISFCMFGSGLSYKKVEPGWSTRVIAWGTIADNAIGWPKPGDFSTWTDPASPGNPVATFIIEQIDGFYVIPKHVDYLNMYHYNIGSPTFGAPGLIL